MTHPSETEPGSEQRGEDPHRRSIPPDWPEFLEEFPDTPALRPLVQAFSKGNYALLRRLERELASHETDVQVLEFAKELVERTKPDPTGKRILLASIGFFLFLVVWVYMGHAH